MTVEAPTLSAPMPERSTPALDVAAAEAISCAHCGCPCLPAPDRRGLRRRFCRPAHREAVRLRRERGLPEDYPQRPNRQGRRRLGAGDA